MTYAELCACLQAASIEDAAFEAELLLAHFCGVDRVVLQKDPARSYTDGSLQRAVERRMRHEPVQYIFGEWDFYRQTYEVSPDCLIPRSDTEILVEQAIRLLPKNAFFADLCTGSGCIAISVLAERTDTRACAAELSDEALAIASKNAVRNGVFDRLELLKADVLAPETVLPEWNGGLDALLSNPPYIKSAVIPTLSEEVQAEPHMALDGGEDGLVFYRSLLKIARRLLKPEGFCLFEIGYDQGEEILQLASDAGFFGTVLRDYGGCDRVAYLKRNGI